MAGRRRSHARRGHGGHAGEVRPFHRPHREDRRITPQTVIREGDKAEALLSLITEDRDIAVLVLAAGTGSDGPGPLVHALAGAAAARFPIPVTIVPGALSDEELDALA